MLSQEENDKILKEEMEALRQEILLLYNASGKKTTGEFEKGLEIKYQPKEATLYGYEYLAGRRAGKQPPIKAIEDWIQAKGINPIEKEMTTSTLAFLIARKIAEKGTDPARHLKVYSQVITPARIDEILERISNLNANSFIEQVVGLITKTFNEFI